MSRPISSSIAPSTPTPSLLFLMIVLVSIPILYVSVSVAFDSSAPIVLASLLVLLPTFCPPVLRVLAHNRIWKRQACPLIDLEAQSPYRIVQVRADALQTLSDGRLRLDLLVKDLQHANRSLRHRIWFLEEDGKALRADITRRAQEYDEVSTERDNLVQENDAFRSEKRVLVESKEDTDAELEAVRRGQATLKREKMALEERLVRKTAGLKQAEEEIKQLKAERAALVAQLETKQVSFEEVMEDAEVLEVDLRKAKENLRDAHIKIADVRSTNTEVVQENEVLKAELERLRHELRESRVIAVSHQDTRDELKTCQRALSVATDECAKLRAALDAHDARQHVSNNVEHTLARALEARDEEISEFKNLLIAQASTIAQLNTAALAHEKDAAELRTYTTGLEGVVEYLKLNPASPPTPASKLSSLSGTPRRSSIFLSGSRTCGLSLSDATCSHGLSSPSPPPSPALAPLILSRNVLAEADASPARTYTLGSPLSLFGF